jgi:hypothetical protein
MNEGRDLQGVCNYNNTNLQHKVLLCSNCTIRTSVQFILISLLTLPVLRKQYGGISFLTKN